MGVNESYSDYLLEHLSNSIGYSEYLAEQIDRNISFSEYLASEYPKNVKRKIKIKNLFK
jgi:hypothetical protein